MQVIAVFFLNVLYEFHTFVYKKRVNIFGFFAGLKNNAKKDLRRTLALRYRISVAYES